MIIEMPDARKEIEITGENRNTIPDIRTFIELIPF